MEEREDSGRKNFIAIVMAELLAITAFAASVPLFPSFLRELGVDDERALHIWSGLASSLPAFMLALFAPIWGHLADAYGRKPMLVRASFGGAVMVGLLFFVRAPWQLLLFRSIQGCFTGTIAAATVLVAASSPREALVTRLGFLQAAVFAGNSVGPFLGGLLADRVGNRDVFAFSSAMLAVAGLIVVFAVRESFRKRTLEALHASRQSEGGGPSILLAILPVLTVMFLFQASLSTVQPVLPTFIENLLPGTMYHRTIAGLVIGVASVTGAFAALSAGLLARRFGHARLLLTFLVSAALVSALQSFVGSWVEFMLLRAVIGFLLGGTMPSLNAMITERIPVERQGSAFGVSTSVQQVGASLGPMIGSGLAWQFGTRASFGGTGALLLAAALAIALPRRERSFK